MPAERYQKQYRLAFCAGLTISLFAIAMGCSPATDTTTAPRAAACTSSHIDVSRAFGATQGISVAQVTSSPGGNELSYYDIPVWSASTNKLFYNSVDPSGNGMWYICEANTDGSNASQVAARKPPIQSADRIDMSGDGQFISYTKLNPDGTSWDFYGFYASTPKNEIHITRQSHPINTATDIKTSPASYDQQLGKYRLVYGIGSTMYTIYDDGSGPGGGTGPNTVLLDDTESGQEFHRVRANPRFPNLVFFRRGSNVDMWVVDLSAPEVHAIRWFADGKSPHETWTPDGQHIGCEVKGQWVEYAVANSAGQLLPGLNATNPSKRVIGQFGGQLAQAFYASYSNDGRWIAVTTAPLTDAGGKIYLVDRASGQARRLTNALSSGDVDRIEAQPRLGFIGGDHRLAFSTDRGWAQSATLPPQIYTVTGF